MASAPTGQKSQGADSAPTPQVKGFRVPAKRIAPANELARALGELAFLRISSDSKDQNVVLALNVESRDISKNPYVFSICYFRPDAIDVLYTQLPTHSPKARKLEVLKYVLNMLTLCTGIYSIDMKYLYQLLEGAISDMNEYVNSDYQMLFSKYDNMTGEYERLLKKLSTMESSNKELANDNYLLKSKNQEMSLKIDNLQTYSDSVLATKIQEWLAEHNGEINLSDFAKVHNVSEARVEQILNRLMSEGYIESRE